MEQWVVGPWTVAVWGRLLLAAIGLTLCALVASEATRRVGGKGERARHWVRYWERAALGIGVAAMALAIPVVRGIERVHTWSAATTSMALVSGKMSEAWFAVPDSAWLRVQPPIRTGALDLKTYHASAAGYTFVYIARNDASLRCVARMPAGTVACAAPWHLRTAELNIPDVQLPMHELPPHQLPRMARERTGVGPTESGQ